jgi:hypothetical protein
MTRIVLAIAMLLCCGCGEELAAPEIEPDVSPMNLGIHVIDPEAPVYQFNLQLTNIGEQKLVIDSVSYRGDQNCSFTFEGPDIFHLKANESAFVRGWYEPTIPAEDQIALIVISNAKTHGELVIPVCALAVTPETTDAEVPVCQVPPETQPDCAAE